MVSHRRRYCSPRDAVPGQPVALGGRGRSRSQPHQQAPPWPAGATGLPSRRTTGFLLAEKAVVELLGDDELALRLFPLACGILSLFLFAAVGRRLLEPIGAALALVLFATVEPLVYYSSEVKQYSVDVAAALVLLLGALTTDWRTARPWKIALTGIGAGVVVWFSHAALIVLPALALALLVTYMLSRDDRAVKAVVAASTIGGVAAAAAYLVNHDNARRVADAAVYSESGSAYGLDRLIEPLRDLWHAFPDPGLARTTTALAVIACLLGVVTLARTQPRAGTPGHGSDCRDARGLGL